MTKCQVALLDQKQYKFNSIQMNGPFLGDLITKDAGRIDDSHLKGILEF